jgi:hypothetical protein
MGTGLVLAGGGNAALFADVEVFIGSDLSSVADTEVVGIRATDQISLEGGTITLMGALKLQGASGATVVRVGINLLGFFNVAPIAQPTWDGSTLASLGAALEALGLVTT